MSRDILLQVGPRSSESGYDWAPSTLLYGEPLNTVLYPRTGIQNKDTATTSGPMPACPSECYALYADTYISRTCVYVLETPCGLFLRHTSQHGDALLDTRKNTKLQACTLSNREQTQGHIYQP